MSSPPGGETETVTLREPTDVVLARQRVRARAARAGFGLVAQTKLITAASELARNCVIHGLGGKATIEEVRLNHPSRVGIRMVIEDTGPGIADIPQAMSEGYTSGGGLGLGLPGSRRLADEFEIQSEPGLGTKVTIVFWIPAT